MADYDCRESKNQHTREGTLIDRSSKKGVGTKKVKFLGNRVVEKIKAGNNLKKVSSYYAPVSKSLLEWMEGTEILYPRLVVVQ